MKQFIEPPIVFISNKNWNATTFEILRLFKGHYYGMMHKKEDDTLEDIKSGGISDPSTEVFFHFYLEFRGEVNHCFNIEICTDLETNWFEIKKKDHHKKGYESHTYEISKPFKDPIGETRNVSDIEISTYEKNILLKIVKSCNVPENRDFRFF